ncbi:iron chelate uptake ABC transporter family permease subunit [Halomonas alkaliantarctica]|nr:iron chelate uptake ABC transporter family permease subunit [Halomonas alkaliantarctica]
MSHAVKIGVWSRASWLCLVAVLLVGVFAGWSLTLGVYPTSPVSALLDSLSAVEAMVLFELRLPRTLGALMVGFALGLSGCLFQGLVRNPLVAPDIIGINAGAGLAAVALIATGTALALVPLAAIGGGLVTAAAIYVLAWKAGIAGNRLVLVGIGINAILGALTSFMIVRFPVESVTPALVWLAGSLSAVQWPLLAWLGATLLLATPVTMILLRRLQLLQLGDDSARALGLVVERDRGLLLLIGACLAGAAVAVAGLIAFVALVAPHIARLLAGPLTLGVLMLSGLTGACLVLLSEMIARHALAPVTLPVGLITAATGAPLFLYLLYKENRKA